MTKRTINKEAAFCRSVEDTIATTMGANAAAARARLEITASQPRRREFGTWERDGAAPAHSPTIHLFAASQREQGMAWHVFCAKRW